MRRTVICSIALSLAVMTGCAKTEENTSEVSFTSPAAPPAASTATAEQTPKAGEATSHASTARSADGNSSVSIRLAADPVIEIVEAATIRSLSSDTKESGKRKYYDVAGSQVVEVKPTDSGFKVRSVDSVLLWKVKISGDKIKISDNEENRNPWVLKTGYTDKAKILDPSENEIGVVRFADPPAPARVRSASGSDEWTIESDRSSAAWGVLMMSAVPRDHQAIIIEELLARGR